MTKFPQQTRCSHGGFGQNRLDKCGATKSKSGKHRNFHHSSAFIQVVRGMLNTQTFGGPPHILNPAAEPPARSLYASIKL